ncbi:MAG: glycerol-3-phosphate dehydrogenase/oxidase [Planctomycetes bacterium]|nr:glycerol-3-phosphate dehydrogenase/oxidase [Planctomycetota bacterium]
MKKHDAIWQQLKDKDSCEVLILGGGINGTGLLRDLAAQGISCVLVDKADFTAGASSTSSRMIHGGLRYLENAEFKLVSEAVAERNRLLQYANHYVKPLKTSIPLDSWFAGLIKSPMVFLGLPVTVGGRGAFVVEIGLWFYDFITRKKRQTPRHFFMSKTKSLKEIPGLRSNITCTANYWDAWISQAERLCVEMIREGVMDNPDCDAINYVTASKTSADEITLTDTLTGEETVIKPQAVVNATGAWVDFANKDLGLDSQFMGGTKGSHLVIENKQLYDALGDRMVYYEHTDGRICITFRFMDRVIMGSTDISVGNPDNAACDNDEIDYMMSTLKGVFPNLELSKGDIVYTFCGVRPLPSSGLDYTSRVSRAHRIEDSAPDENRSFPIYSMIGGKLTTFGAFARQTADKVLDKLGKKRTVSVSERPYLGAVNYPADETAKQAWIERVASANNLQQDRVAELLERYGTEAEKIASETNNTPLENLGEYSVGEIEYIAENECIQHLLDITRRRSIITITGRGQKPALEEIAKVAGNILGWDSERQTKEAEQAFNEQKVSCS